jgi:hypothetical protein
LNRSSTPGVRYHVLLYVIVLSALVGACGALTGCGIGGDDDTGPPTRTTAFKRSELTKPADSGTFDGRACDALSRGFVARSLRIQAAKLEAKPNDSLDLSICDWHGGRATAKLMVDSAPRAQLRYYNLLAEQLEYYNADPGLKARQIKGVGEDAAYGGAGAWWTRARNQLVAYDRDKMLKLRVNVPGFSDGDARAAAVTLAKRVVRKLRRAG